jgi:O-antigen/teichoic acid export membrane protein
LTAGSWSSETRTGIFWSATASFAGKALALVATLVLARLLTPAEFGVVAAILVYLTFVELVSDLGMQATVVYEQEDGVSERVQTAFTINLVLVLLLTGLAVLLAPIVADFFNVEGQTHLFRLGALNLILVGLGNIPDALLLRGMEFRRRTMPMIVRAGISGVVSIALAVAGLGPEALVLGLLAGSAAWTIVLWLMTRFRPRLSFDAGVARSMAGYGSTSTALDGISAVGSRVDQATIGPVLGPQALGLYTIGFRAPDVLLNNVSIVVSHVAFPALSRRRRDDRSELPNATLALVRYQALYALSAAAGLAVLASPLVVVLFSDAWKAAGGVMAAIAVKAALSAIAFPLGDALRSVGQQRLLVAINLVEVPLLIVLVIVAAPEGIVVVAWVRALLAVLHLALVTVLASRNVQVGFAALVRAVAPGLVGCAGVAAGAGAVRLSWPDLSVLPLLAGMAAGVVGGLLALRAFAPTQARSLLRHLREATASGRVTAGAGASRG